MTVDVCRFTAGTTIAAAPAVAIVVGVVWCLVKLFCYTEMLSPR